MSEPDWRDLLDPDDDNLEYDVEQPEENTYGDFQDAANQREAAGDSDPHVGIAEAADRVADGTAVIIDSSKVALALYVTSDGEVQVQSAYDEGQVAAILRQIANKADARHKSGL